MREIIIRNGIYFLYGKSIYKIISKLPGNKIEALDVIARSSMILENKDLTRLKENGEIHYIYNHMTYQLNEKRKKKQRSAERESIKGKLRYKVIKPLLDNPDMTVKQLIGQICQNEKLLNEMKKHRFSFSMASIYRWVKKYRQNNHGNPTFVSNKNSKVKPSKSKLSALVSKIMDRYISAAVLTSQNITSSHIHFLICAEITKRNETYPNEKLNIPSHRTVHRRVKMIQAKRIGERFFYHGSEYQIQEILPNNKVVAKHVDFGMIGIIDLLDDIAGIQNNKLLHPECHVGNKIK